MNLGNFWFNNNLLYIIGCNLFINKMLLQNDFDYVLVILTIQYLQLDL